MGEKDLFDYWSDTYKVHTLEWSREKAFEILKEWQAKFSEEVSRLVENTNNIDKENKYSRKKYEIHAFSSSHLDSILKEFSEFNWRNIGLACGMMVSLYKKIHRNNLKPKCILKCPKLIIYYYSFCSFCIAYGPFLGFLT